MPLRPGDRQLIREWNESLVLDLIRRHEPLTRVSIAQRSGLGRSTVTTICTRLIRQGLVTEDGSVETGDAGRRPTLLRLQAHSRTVLALKLAPASVTAAVLDLHAEPQLIRVRPLTDGSDPDAVCADLLTAARQVTEEAPPDLGPLIGAGLVMPGVIAEGAEPSFNPYYDTWVAARFRTHLEEALAIPVLVENDANAAALAEGRYGAGRGCETLLSVTVGVGIGAGVLVGGQLHRGHRAAAGEIGHVVVDPDGPPCRCGRRGCLEAIASDEALARKAGRPFPAIVQSARSGDPHSRTLLAEAGRLIGSVIAGAVNLLSPDRVVVGGEALLEAGDLLLQPLADAIHARTAPVQAAVQVVPARLGQTAWVRGAAALVLDEAFRVPLHRQSGPAPAIFRTTSDEE